MIAISNTNQPSWKTVNVKSYIPESLKPLEEVARNLWWVWNEEAKELFAMLDKDLYKACSLLLLFPNHSLNTYQSLTLYA